MFRKTSAVILSVSMILSVGLTVFADDDSKNEGIDIVSKLNSNLKKSSNQEVQMLKKELQELIEQAEDTDTKVLKTDDSIKELEKVINSSKQFIQSENVDEIKNAKNELQRALIQIERDEYNIKDINTLKKKPELVKGTYTVPVVLRNFEFTEQNSMGNHALLHKAKLIVEENGSIRLRFKLKALYMNGAYGHLTNLWYYNDTTKESVGKHDIDALGNLTKVNVISKVNQPDMYGKMRGFIEVAELNISKFTDNPKRYVKVKVDAMDIINGIEPYENPEENSTSPNAIITIDYRFIEKDSNNSEELDDNESEIKKLKNEAKKKIDDLSKLSMEDKLKFKSEVDKAKNKEDIEKILKQARELNDKNDKKVENKKVEKVERFSGKNRYETSVEVSENNFKSAGTVILASGENISDALVSSSFATIKEAPILLTSKNSISEDVLDEIDRLKADEVIIIGGKSSISESVASRLRKEDLNVIRIAGKDRFDTSSKLAQEVVKLSDKSRKAILVNGFKNADALSVSSIATKDELPIFMNGNNSLNSDIKNQLKKMNINKIFIIGGVNSISKNIEKELKNMNINIVRLAGRDRYETSMNIAKYAYKTSDNLIVASGENSVDALSASVLTEKKNAPILLLNNKKISESIEKYIEDMEASKIIIVGGESSISENIEEDLEDLI